MPSPVIVQPLDFIRFVPRPVLRDYTRTASPEKSELLKRLKAESASLTLDSGDRLLEAQIYAELLALDGFGS